MDKLDRDDYSTVSRWERFCERHGGAMPSLIAAKILRMTPQGVWQASQRGWIAYLDLGGKRYYSPADVRKYRWTRAQHFADNKPYPTVKKPNRYWQSRDLDEPS